MKQLYRKKGKVHPSPPISDPLSLLPATILTLTVALSPEEKEVLAYLISCSGSSNCNFSGDRRVTRKSSEGSSGKDHPPLFHCDCFRCYMSYWVRWDSSPNRQLIHEIIDALEDGSAEKMTTKRKKDRKKKDSKSLTDKTPPFVERSDVDELGAPEAAEVSSCDGDVGEIGDEDGDVAPDKGTLRKLLGSIGEKILGVWHS